MSLHISQIPELSGVTETFENSRKNLAYIISWSFVAVIGITVLYAVLSNDLESINKAKELIATIASVFGGLVGSIVGFYFGTKSKE